MNENEVILTLKEIELIKALNFDKEVALKVKQYCNSKLEQIKIFDDFLVKDILINGICCFYHSKIENQEEFRVDLSKKGYLVFEFYNIIGNKMGIIKGNDTIEIIKQLHTSSSNYGITNQILVEQLYKWKKTSDFIVLGACGQYFELKFIKLPLDIGLFISEAIKICPELYAVLYDLDILKALLNKEVRSTRVLSNLNETQKSELIEKYLKKFKRITFWWD